MPHVFLIPRAFLAFAAAALLVVSAGCGTTPTERGVSGAGLGAGAGAATSAIVGANPLVGALAGGALGGATGALTNPNQVDLGKPVWQR